MFDLVCPDDNNVNSQHEEMTLSTILSSCWFKVPALCQAKSRKSLLILGKKMYQNNTIISKL